jgi:hypothetical protein
MLLFVSKSHCHSLVYQQSLLILVLPSLDDSCFHSKTQSADDIRWAFEQVTCFQLPWQTLFDDGLRWFRTTEYQECHLVFEASPLEQFPSSLLRWFEIFTRFDGCGVILVQR